MHYLNLGTDSHNHLQLYMQNGGNSLLSLTSYKWYNPEGEDCDVLENHNVTTQQWLHYRTAVTAVLISKSKRMRVFV